MSDFLLTGKGNWWIEHENGDIEFHDGEHSPDFHPEGPSIHHFRSSNFNNEEKYLHECWKECLCMGVPLPVKVLRVEDEQGNMNGIHSCVGRVSIPVHNTDTANNVNEPDKQNLEVEDNAETTEENIVSFQLVPDSISELSPDALIDDNDEVGETENQNHLSLGSKCVATDNNSGIVQGITYTVSIYYTFA